ncbi:hypothetical protein ECP02994832_4859 [Escherichia coli P0299483.2]|nr:hypothetical protein ECP02994832_4859 [Escherichia coli P0299483.2]
MSDYLICVVIDTTALYVPDDTAVLPAVVFTLRSKLDGKKAP